VLITRLVQYAEHSAGRTPRYYRNRVIRWALAIDASGRLKLLDLAEDGRHGKAMATPYLTRTSGIAPMLLSDSLEYVLGVPKDDTDKARAGADKRHDAYLDLLKAWYDDTRDPDAEVIWDAFRTGAHRALTPPEESRPKAKPSDNVAIMVNGRWAHDLPSAQAYWAKVAKARKSSGNDGLCLCCGTTGPLLKTIPDMVKSSLIPVGVDSRGRPKRGRDAALISVNTSAQGRMGVVQLANTPVCEDCGSRTMAALNTLLSDERHHRKGEDSVLTWWLRDDDGSWDPMVIERPEPADVRALLESVQKANPDTEVDENAFYAVTLSANQSRVVVRDWLELPVSQHKRHVASWFLDHASVDVWKDGAEHYVPLWQMVRASGRWDRSARRYVPGSSIHGLERGLLRSALYGAAPPPQLVPHLLHRIRNDHHVDLARVALLRLALRRMPGVADEEKEKIMPGLDETETHPAYVWGRVFAVLEEIQHQAIPNLNASIRDRYFGLAMAQPAPTFRQLRLNANGHLKKLTGREDSRPAGYALGNRLAEISKLFEADGLPSSLNTHDQVRFILGYDHQRAFDMEAKRAGAAAKAARRAANDDTSQES
jgi:CRISPR-associated protein Csd1